MGKQFDATDPNVIGIGEELGKSSKILISSHKSPDGDAVGSSLALCLFLEKLGHHVEVLLPDEAPEFLHWLPSYERIHIAQNNDDVVDRLISESELLFVLDYNSFSRVGKELGEKLSSFNGNKIMIDHHQEPDEFPIYSIHDTAASSTAQLVHDLIFALGKKELIDKEIGACLYTAIMTDTGSFRFASCTSHTMRIIADMLDLGVDGNLIHQLVYDQNSIDRLHLTGYALEKIKMIDGYHTAFISLSREELERFNYKSGDTEGLVNRALSVKGVKVACLISEKESGIRMSFRSSAQFSVNDFARKHFNGGGHFHAAGGSFDGNMENAIDSFIAQIKNYKNELENA